VWRDDRHGVWGIATYDLVKEVSVHPELFSSAQGIRPDTRPVPMMIDMDNPQHSKRRRLVSSGFTPRRVRAQEPLIRNTVRTLVDAVVERGECDLVWDIAAWLPLIVIGDALGVEPPDRQQLLQWSDDLLRGLGTDDQDLVAAMVGASVSYHDYAAQVLKARHAAPTDDLMSVLVHAEVDGDRLDDEEIIMESLLILIGGDETTRHVMSGGAYQLLRHRERWEALLADRTLLGSAIEEMLRWVSPIKNMARVATRDVEIGGATVPAGEKVMLLYPSANRDEKVFADSFDFNIRRQPNDHVAFGYGTHHCVGANLARLELRVLFEELLDRMPNLELVSDEEPSYRPANFVSGYESLAVRF
jgi:cytochrome P450 family 142 subfamily A polypeptide 1